MSAQIVNASSHNYFASAPQELSTDWKRKKYYKANLHFLEPFTVKYVKDHDIVTDSFSVCSTAGQSADAFKF